ncbi:hypothetical protein [Stakelama tenebrarum]|nr:hypothetical protein [Sphingosinithalassobacter tenebrarum]
MIAAVGRELFDTGLAGLSRVIPKSVGFWVFFLLAYLIPPTFDWFIFRKLWRIPLSGMVALHKKRISNETLIGYSGEAYFYAWARQRTKMVAAPFGAVKDVMIMSAMAGHAVTLTMLAVALPLGIELLEPDDQQTVLLAAGAVVIMTLPFIIFSRRVFSLPVPTLWWVFGMQASRIISGSVMLAFAWYFALPEVSVGMWLILVAGRLLVSRLPFLPQKETVFAAFAILMIGRGDAISELLAFTAALSLLLHALLIGCFSLFSILRKEK